MILGMEPEETGIQSPSDPVPGSPKTEATPS